MGLSFFLKCSYHLPENKARVLINCVLIKKTCMSVRRLQANQLQTKCNDDKVDGNNDQKNIDDDDKWTSRETNAISTLSKLFLKEKNHR